MRHKSKSSVLAGLGVASSKLEPSPITDEMPKGFPEPFQTSREQQDEIIERCRAMRSERDEILARALEWCERNVQYVPLDVMEDIENSYADDSFEDFERTVRMWLEVLMEVEKKRRSA